MRRCVAVIGAAVLAVALAAGAAGAAVLPGTGLAQPAPTDEQGETLGRGALGHVAVIAAAFDGVDEEQVLALKQQGVGFGAIVKLLALAEAAGTSVDDLLAEASTGPDGELEFDFGALRAELTPEQLAGLSDLPTNFGQLKKAAKFADGHPGRGLGKGLEKQRGG